MRFSNAATLFSFASFAYAAPATHAHSHVHARDTSSNVSGTKFQSGIFYVNWAIYARKHFVTDLPAEKLTKINYAFANINNVTGEVYLTDVWADTQFPYPGDVIVNPTAPASNDTSSNSTAPSAPAAKSTQLLGNFNQLFKLKQKNRNLKVILSVGGWSYRTNFKPGLATAEQRQKFCTSSIKLIADLGLDGFDIDWEYPDDATDAANLVDTVQRCRKIYDEYSQLYANGYHFALGISAPAGPQWYTIMPVKEMDPYIDYWNLMAFDYQGGGFSNFTGHLSNVYASSTNPKSTNGWVVEDNKFVPFDTAQAIDYYTNNVASSRKIHLGMPLYGRSFANVVDLSKDGKAMGQKFNGSGEGTYEPGTLDYKVLPQNGTKLFDDKEVLASWTWDAAKKQVVSFDTPKVASWKVDYLKKACLGGAWYWESSGDKDFSSPDSLVNTVVGKLGGADNLHQDMNNLYYPKSQYDNIRSARPSR